MACQRPFPSLTGRGLAGSRVGGAGIGVWQPGLHQGFGVFGEPDTPSWFELHTSDYQASVGFYRNVFGWDTHVASDTPEFRYTTLRDGEDWLAGIMDASGFLPDGVSAVWSVYFGVEDTDATLAKIVDLGGSIVMAAEDTRMAVSLPPPTRPAPSSSSSLPTRPCQPETPRTEMAPGTFRGMPCRRVCRLHSGSSRVAGGVGGVAAAAGGGPGHVARPVFGRVPSRELAWPGDAGDREDCDDARIYAIELGERLTVGVSGCYRRVARGA